VSPVTDAATAPVAADASPGAAGARGLSAKDLAAVRGDRVLFSGIDLAVAPGQALQVAGPNGSGKTTLLRVLCGLGRPDAGEVRWRGVPVARDRGAFHAALAWVGHADGVKLDLGVRENLRAARGIAGRGSASHEARVLDRLGLAPFAQSAVRALSAGQRRRVALARLLVLDAALWVLDEPFTALDRQTVALVETLVREQLAAGGMVVYSSHHTMDLEGCDVSDLHLFAASAPA